MQSLCLTDQHVVIVQTQPLETNTTRAPALPICGPLREVSGRGLFLNRCICQQMGKYLFECVCACVCVGG